TNGAHHKDLFREAVDLPIFKSHSYDFEQLLMHDGCTGVAVMSSEAPMEVQFDEHKLLIVYAPDLQEFERVMKDHRIPRNDRIRLITEGEHLHSTDQTYREMFEQFCYRLGVGKAHERVESGDWSE